MPEIRRGAIEFTDRLDALEKRVRSAEDQLEIIGLVSTYGPLVDAGNGEDAARLWTEDGRYDIRAGYCLTGFEELAQMYEGTEHQDLIHEGSAHVTSTPQISLEGDTAEAVAYSLLIRKSADNWIVWRAAANHWRLTRTAQGWRISERYRRLLDGSDASHDVLRRIRN